MMKTDDVVVKFSTAPSDRLNMN